jgi:putative SOS response-associated peptidase YedK
MTHNFRWRTIHALLSLKKVPDEDWLFASFNVAPTQRVPVVRNAESGERELVEMRWGLIPSWAKDRKLSSSLINARSETVDQKPAFRSAFKARRCVLPASGFYEWLRTGAASRPHYLCRGDGQPMLLAGLWDSWLDKDSGELVETCTIITTDANAVVRGIHDRMPVILEPAQAQRWIDPRTPTEEAKALLSSAPDGMLNLREVSTRVNSPRVNDPSLINRL